MASAFQRNAFQRSPAFQISSGAGGLPSGGRPRHVKIKKHEGFSRKYYDELRAAQKALVEAEKAAVKLKQAQQQEAAQHALAIAQEAIAAAASESAHAVDLQRITLELQSAARSKVAADVLAQLRRAELTAVVMAKAEFEQDEEEAITLLLMH